MNKNILRDIIMLLIGGAVGSAVTYKLAMKQCEQIAQEEIDSMREYYIGKSPKKDANKEPVDTDEEDSEYKDVVVGQSLFTAPKRPRINYSDPAETDHPPEDEPEPEEDIYIISAREFIEENEHYEKQTLYFYEVDRALTDEQDELVDQDTWNNIEERNLTRFGEVTGSDPNTLYVRNRKKKADYEIVLHKESYRESVLGMYD